MNFLKDIATNCVTTTNLAIPESDINVTTPPGSHTFTLQQQMYPSCHPVVSQSSEELLQLTAHNHKLKTVTPKQDKKGKQKTSVTDEVNEFDEACLDLLQKKWNSGRYAFLLKFSGKSKEFAPPQKKKLSAKSKIMTVLFEMCDDQVIYIL